jgi:DNA-binding NarL/FixJ family response regulator
MEMSSAPTLRVLVDGSDAVAAPLGERIEPVHAPPADVALIGLPGEVDDAAVGRVTGLRDRTGLPVVAIVDGDLSPRATRALAGTAQGVVERDGIDAALAVTLQAVAAGQSVLPAPLRHALERPPLSNREKQILAMVVLGCSNAEIADKLVITESTVKNHLSSAFTKLGVRSRSAATSLILDPATGLGLGVLQISADRPAGVGT